MIRKACRYFKGSLISCEKGIVPKSLTNGEVGWMKKVPCVGGDEGIEKVGCSQFQGFTKEEIDKMEAEVKKSSERMKRISQFIEGIREKCKGKEDVLGECVCPECGKKLKYRVSGYNRHIWACCETDDCINFME